ERGLRVPARVRELHADEQVVSRAVPLAMRVDERVSQRGDIPQRLPLDDELMRIGPAVVTHRDGLAAPDDLCTADPEVGPASPGEIGRGTIDRAVPAFHRQDAPAVPGPHRRSRPRVDPLSEYRGAGRGKGR